MEKNLITVTGNGQVHVEPDITRLEINLQSIHDTYEDAYTQAKSDTERLGEIMKELSLDTSLPKTIRFDIDIKTRREYDKYGNMKADKFIGFGLDHTLVTIGGDTLAGFMKKAGCSELTPVCELSDGVVCSTLGLGGREVQIVSKSGGFGKSSVLTDVVSQLVTGGGK